MAITMMMRQRRWRWRSAVNEWNKWPLCCECRCVFGLRFHFPKVWEPKAGAIRLSRPTDLLCECVSLSGYIDLLLLSLYAASLLPLLPGYSCVSSSSLFLFRSTCCLLLFAPFIVFLFSLFRCRFSSRACHASPPMIWCGVLAHRKTHDNDGMMLRCGSSLTTFAS